MSVIVKGMGMPETCVDCDMCEYSICAITNTYCGARYTKRNFDCPLLPLPDEHGRLIDADKLLKDSGLASHTWIDKAPTVVPAERGKNEL